MQEMWVQAQGQKDPPENNPLQYSCLGNPMDRGAWRAMVHGSLKELDVTWRLNNKQYLANTAAAEGSSTQEAKVTSASCIAIAEAAVSFW